MRQSGCEWLRGFLKEELGQSAVVVAITITTLMALAATSVEAGHIYYAHQRLVASTNAAALAAGQAMPDIGTSGDSMTSGSAWGNLKQYSSITNGYNATSLLTNVQISASFSCTSTATSLNVFCEENNGTGTACKGSSISSWCNTVTVTQTATVHLWFGGLIGMPSMTIAAKAEAAMSGGHPPYNIAVIIDTTESMKNAALSNDNCTGGGSEIACAVSGLEQMLLEMYPCLNTATCSSTSEEADGVALFVFPPIEDTTKDDASDDTTCPSSNPPIVPYSFEDVTGSASTQNLLLPTSASTYGSSVAGTYQVTGFDTAYKQTDGSTTLSTDDPLVIAAGGSGSSDCKGLQAPGGEGTYYAQVIQAAQAALIAQQNLMKATYDQPTDNIMIILSDGDATSCNTQATTGNTCGNGGSQIYADNCPTINGTSASAPCVSPYAGMPLNGTEVAATKTTAAIQPTGWNNPAYPSAIGECGQAVWAAQQATEAGTTVYTVAMGAETSNSCLTDSTYTLTGLSDGAVSWPTGAGNGVQASLPSGQACAAIAAMASNANTFYSDDQNGCASTANSVFESMASIFDDVSKKLSTSRLIPVGSP